MRLLLREDFVILRMETVFCGWNGERFYDKEPVYEGPPIAVFIARPDLAKSALAFSNARHLPVHA